MEKFSQDGISASVILDARREKQDGLYPVKYVAYFNHKRYYFPCMDLSKKEWDLLENTKKRELINIRATINKGFERFTDHIKALIENGGFTIQGLDRRINRGTIDSIIDAFNNKINGLNESNHIGTSSWYLCSKNSIENYISKDLKFSDVTPEWLHKYEDHLLKEKKSYTTISMYLRALRAVLNDAIADGIISQVQYPFESKNNGKYKIPEGEGRKLALTLPQINQVFDYPIAPDDEKWRALWIFSFYCNGINMADLLRLKYKNIENDEIAWYRQKTIKMDKKKKKIRAIIGEEMQEIIDKFGNKNYTPETYIFPYLTPGMKPIDERNHVKNITRAINSKMGKIGKALGIEGLSTYAARHSYATLSKNGNMPLALISENMGHSNLLTTEAYFAAFDKEQRIKYAGVLPKRNKI